MKRIIYHLTIGTICLCLIGMSQIQSFSAQVEQPESQNQFQSNAKNLRLNFRGVPLQTVLDYLSEAAGFIIVLETEVTGNVDVWSMQPLSQDEAVNLLNTVLHQKGYAAIRNGRTLTIVKREDARQRDLPVKTGSNPDRIPKTDEMVTQVIPVRYTNATQLLEIVQPLLPSYATLGADESSNSLVLTDTQANIKRMAEIIQALDTSISSISAVKVFSLRYSDAKELAEMIEELFSTENSGNNQQRGQMPPFFGRQGGGRGGRGEGQEEESDSEARKAASKVVAVADERTNSLVVTAPEELMPTITQLVVEVDTQVEDITVLRVFHLKNADASETASLLQELFPDETDTQTSSFSPRFMGPGGGPGGLNRGMPGGNTNQSDSSERKMQQSKVIAVADPRTNSVAVTASREVMNQIELMIQQLDNSPEKKQKVYVYTLEYGDVENIAEILRNMFEQQNGYNNRGSSSTSNQNSSTFSNRTMTNTGQTNQSNFGGGNSQPFQ